MNAITETGDQRGGTPSVPFGQQVGLTERALRHLLNDLLDQERTTFAAWVALNTLATRGPAIPLDALHRDLATPLQADTTSISEALDQLKTTGATEVVGDPSHDDGSSVRLTAEGAARHRQLRDVIGGLTATLLADIDPHRLAVTLDVLRRVTARAESMRPAEGRSVRV